MVLKKTLESSMDCTEIKPVNSKGNQLIIFIGRTDAEAEAPILWPPDGKSLLMKVKVKSLNHVQTVAYQALPSMGFSRQEHWSGLPFPSPMHESEN